MYLFGLKMVWVYVFIVFLSPSLDKYLKKFLRSLSFGTQQKVLTLSIVFLLSKLIIDVLYYKDPLFATILGIDTHTKFCLEFLSQNRHKKINIALAGLILCKNYKKWSIMYSIMSRAFTFVIIIFQELVLKVALINFTSTELKIRALAYTILLSFIII